MNFPTLLFNFILGSLCVTGISLIGIQFYLEEIHPWETVKPTLQEDSDSQRQLNSCEVDG